MTGLDVDDRRAVRRVLRQLEEAWVENDPLIATGRAMTSLLPESPVCIYRTGTGGDICEMVEDVSGPLRRAPFAPRTRKWVERNRLYSLGGNDRWANRAVALGALTRGRPDVREATRDNVLRPYGMDHQLRVALYDELDRFVGYCALGRTKRQRDFGAREHAVLQAVTPSLIDVFWLMQHLSDPASALRQIGRGSELFDQPAWLVAESGAVLYGNREARRQRTVPPWLRRIPRADHRRLSVRVAKLQLDGRPVWLAVDRRRRGPDESKAESWNALPPSLREVAQLLARGLTDKEISSCTGLTLATTRTYVTRVFQRLGVHDRRELMAHAARSHGPGTD